MNNFFQLNNTPGIILPPSSQNTLQLLSSLSNLAPTAENGYTIDENSGYFFPPEATTLPINSSSAVAVTATLGTQHQILHTSASTLGNSTPLATVNLSPRNSVLETSASTSSSTSSTLPYSLPANFESIVEEAVSATEIQRLRNFTFEISGNTRKRKAKKRPGPKVSTVSVKIYHLPPASSKPCFTKADDPLVLQHFDSGYGYAKQCFTRNPPKISRMGFNINLSERQFHEKLKELFVHLTDNYSFYTVSHSGEYDLKVIKTPADIKRLEYSGTLVLSNNSTPIPHHRNVSCRAEPIRSSLGPAIPFTPPETTTTAEPNSSESLPSFLSSPSTVEPLTPHNIGRRYTFLSSLPNQARTIISNVLLEQSSNYSNLGNANIADSVPSTISSNSPVSMPSSTLLSSTQAPSRESYVTTSATDRAIPLDSPVSVPSSTLSRTQPPSRESYLTTSTTDHSIPSDSPVSVPSSTLSSRTQASSRDSHLTTSTTEGGVDSLSGGPSIHPQSNRPMDLKTLQFLRARRQLICNRGPFLLTVSRLDICTSIIKAYATNPDIGNCRLVITFEGEKGSDLNGLSREFFSMFWSDFIQKYCEGHAEFNVEINPLNRLSSQECFAVGQILAQGIIQVGYLPIHLNNATLFFLIAKCLPSKNLLSRSFRKTLCQYEQDLLLRSGYDEVAKIQLVNLFSRYAISGVPNPTTIEYFVEMAAFYAAIAKPHFYISSIQNGAYEQLQSLADLFDEDFFCHLAAKMQPSGERVIKNCRANFSENEFLKAKEEAVFDFLKAYLMALSFEKAATFLKYVTGVEVLLGIIFVEFNGEDNPSMMLPSSNTCSQTLHLSRYINSQNQLNDLLNGILKDGEHWKFSVV